MRLVLACGVLFRKHDFKIESLVIMETRAAGASIH